MTDRRVVITGVGVVTAGGVGAEAFFAGLLARSQHVRAIDLFDATTFPCRIGAQLDDFSARPYVPRSYRKAVKVMARDIEIAVAAADLAVLDAALVTAGIDDGEPNVDSARVGCNIGAGLICPDLDELGAAVNTAVVDGQFDFKMWGREGMANLTPLWLLKYLPNMLACHVTIIHQAKGPSNTITCGEVSGHLAVGEASRTVARGGADLAIAGGAESKLNPMGLLRQGLLGRLTTTGNDAPAGACRPFDADHAGTVVGEGGGLLIVEDRDRAVGRGARVYAEVAGFAAACDPDGTDYTRPHAGGLAPAVAGALAEAGIAPGEIDLVIPNGTGVPAEDVAEADALKQALGDRADGVPVVPLTGGIGDLFAGAGGAQLAAGAIALARQTIPPAVNGENPDPACGLNLPAAPIETELRHVLCAAVTPGGQSAAIVLKRHEP